MLADTDAGNVVTAAQSGSQWGYRLLPLLLLLIPPLYMIQELTVRLGICTGAGHGELIREKFGRKWSLLAVVGLAVATIGSLLTEFTAVAGMGDLYGLSRSISLPVAAAALLGVVLTGSYRRVERVAIAIGLFELAFFAVAWMAHADVETIARHAVDFPVGNHDFMFLAAALIGAVFNPWMIFYQQAAVADKKLKPEDLRAARLDTAIGAVLTQLLTAAILVAAAATMGAQKASHVRFQSVGDISEELASILGGP
jgi:Mn2+/Fe2+ NRAMP family transporter